MSIVVNTEARIRNIKVTSDTITAYLIDGRVLSVPLAWSWRLSEASAAQRANFEIIGDGQGVHWPDVDEDISVDGMLHGVPARRPQTILHFRKISREPRDKRLRRSGSKRGRPGARRC
jgi:Protein of unknown function (DUF2442)